MSRLKRFSNHSDWITILAFILSGFSFSNVQSQTPQFISHSLSNEKDQPIPTVFLEDANGLIWIGTNHGLYQYDGMTSKLILMNDSLQSTEVTALFEDKNHVLWVGFKSGEIATKVNETLQLLMWEEGFPKVPITGLLVDDDDKLWISTYGEGVYYYQNNRLYNINTDDGLADNDIYTMTLAPDRKVWLGSDGGISICEIKDQEKIIQNLGTEDGLPDNIVKKLITDGKDNIWIGMDEQGVGVFNFSQNKIIPLTQNGNWNAGSVISLHLYENEIWVGTKRNGIIKLSKQEGIYKGQYPSAINQAFGQIRAISSDQEGNIWIADDQNGVLTTLPRLEFVKSNQTQPIHALMIDNQQKVWYATDENVYTFDPVSQTIVTQSNLEYISQSGILSLYEDPMGYIWIGTFGDGVYRYNPKSGTQDHIGEKDGLVNGNVLSLAGKNNALWFATLGGVSRCVLPDASQAPMAFESFTQEDGLGTNYTYSVFIDSQDRVWFATDGKGITVLENGQFTNYGSNDGLGSEVIYSIQEDELGQLWFSAADDGLYVFKNGEFKHLDTADGLRDRTIVGLASDLKGHILAIHPTGIDVIDVNSFQIQYLGTSAGMDAINPNINVVDKDASGNIWVGTEKGLIRYSPPSEPIRTTPEIIIKQVSLFLHPLQDTSQHDFSFDENNFTFEFVGLWYQAPEEVRYEYQLIGHDPSWTQTKTTKVIYPRLAPGKYTFQVKASTYDNFDKASIAVYSFEVGRPFWLNPWFYIFLAVAFFAAIYFWLKIRDKRIRKNVALEKEKILFQFETLRNQVNPHFLFNSFNTLVSIIEEDQQVAIDYVDKLSELFRNMLAFREKTVITLAEELELLATYYYLQQKRFGSNFTLKIDLSESAKASYIPPLTLQMLIENAVKHNIVSKSKPLTVNIFINKNGYLEVKNCLQRKRNLPKKSTHLGLENIRRRYELLNDKPILISQESDYFIVALPLLTVSTP